MTSKERVLKALNHEEPDRVPFMYRDVPEVRKRLKADLKLSTDDELFEYLGIDFRWVAPKYIGPAPDDPETGYRKDYYGVQYQYTKFSETAGYWNMVNPPLKDVNDPKVLEDYPWPDLDCWDFSGLEEECKKYEHYAIMTAPGILSSPGLLQSVIQPLIGVERSLTEMYINPEFLEILINKILDFQCKYVEKMMSSANGKINFFRIGDDFGTQQGLLMSLESINKFFLPGFKIMADIAKKYDAHYYHHSCGSIRDIIPGLIEIGVDVIDPIQVNAYGMDPSELKRYFGDIITLSGGIDEQEILPFGSPEKIRNEVLRIIDIMAPGGGYFLGPTHNFQDDCPIENILAMYLTANNEKINK